MTPSMLEARRAGRLDQQKVWECCGKAFAGARSYISHRSHHKRERVDAPERFWARVDKSGCCWVWTGSCNNKGYGRFDGEYAHRFSWRLLSGPIPDGLNVLHRCDNPPCVRPDHLFLGTVSDNARDMWAKGRGVLQRPGVAPRGDAHHFRRNPEMAAASAARMREAKAARAASLVSA